MKKFKVQMNLKVKRLLFEKRSERNKTLVEDD